MRPGFAFLRLGPSFSTSMELLRGPRDSRAHRLLAHYSPKGLLHADSLRLVVALGRLLRFVPEELLQQFLPHSSTGRPHAQVSLRSGIPTFRYPYVQLPS